MVNPILILAVVDDLGWASVSWHNPMRLYTPELDALVASGVRLERHYAFSYCSPSRSSMLSGRLPGRVNQNNDHYAFAGSGIPLGMTLLPRKLKGLGYATHAVGKWHVGLATPEHLPKQRGFDSFLGFLGGGEDHFTHELLGPDACAISALVANASTCYDLWLEDAPFATAPARIYSDALFGGKCVEIIKRADAETPEEPFFLYAAFHNVHAPQQVPEDYVSLYEARFADLPRTTRANWAQSSYVDDSIRNMTHALQKSASQQWDRTVFVVVSDNGGPIYPGGSSSNWPLRGGKVSAWDGGLRVNCLVSGGLVPPRRRGTAYHGLTSIADWYATMCTLGGGTATWCTEEDDDDAAAADRLPAIDSKNLWPSITGETKQEPRGEIALAVGDGGCIIGFTVGAPSTGSPADDIGCLGVRALVARVDGALFKVVEGERVGMAVWSGSATPTGAIVSGLDAQGVPRSCPYSGNEAAAAEGCWVNCSRPGCLFNLDADPAERVDLSTKDPNHRRILADLGNRLDRHDAAWFNPARTPYDPQAWRTALQGYGGFVGPYTNLTSSTAGAAMDPQTHLLSGSSRKPMMSTPPPAVAAAAAAARGRRLEQSKNKE